MRICLMPITQWSMGWMEGCICPSVVAWIRNAELGMCTLIRTVSCSRGVCKAEIHPDETKAGRDAFNAFQALEQALSPREPDESWSQGNPSTVPAQGKVANPQHCLSCSTHSWGFCCPVCSTVENCSHLRSISWAISMEHLTPSGTSSFPHSLKEQPRI